MTALFLTLCNLLKLGHKVLTDNETGNDLQRMICAETSGIKKLYLKRIQNPVEHLRWGVLRK